MLFNAKLAHSNMIASLYGNSSTKIEDGNKQIHEMYISALDMIPYIRNTTSASTRSSEIDELVELWKKINNKSDTDGAADLDSGSNEKE